MAVSAVSAGYTYAEMDCQAFVEFCVNQAGGKMDYRGSNHMARSAVWLGTIENAKAAGKLVPGAGLLIHEEGESGLPAQYRGDGLGDFSHVGLYVGEDALVDRDKNGKKRSCNVAHSSSTMGRVAGSTLKNGWTHVMWFGEIDYGVEVTPGVELGAEIAEEAAQPTQSVDSEVVAPQLTAGTPASAQALTAGTPAAAQYAVVRVSNGNPVKLRRKASTNEPMYWLVNCDAVVLVERYKGEWALITAICSDGVRRRGYMMRRFLINV